MNLIWHNNRWWLSNTPRIGGRYPHVEVNYGYDPRMPWPAGEPLPVDFDYRTAPGGDMRQGTVDPLNEYEVVLNRNPPAKVGRFEKLEDVTNAGGGIPDDRKIYPFRMKYDTLDEVNRRLKNSIVLVSGRPVYVEETNQLRNGEFELIIFGQDNVRKKLNYTQAENVNTRSIQPEYIRKNGQIGYVTRLPARCNSQGMTHENTGFFTVGKGKRNNKEVRNFFERSQLPSFLGALADKDVVPWEEKFHGLMSKGVVTSFRMSPNLAVFYNQNQDRPFIEYKNRVLGHVEGSSVVSDDLPKPWIVNALREVNMTLKTGDSNEDE